MLQGGLFVVINNFFFGNQNLGVQLYFVGANSYFLEGPTIDFKVYILKKIAKYTYIMKFLKKIGGGGGRGWAWPPIAKCSFAVEYDDMTYLN